MGEAWRWVALAMLPVLWVLTGSRLKSRRLGALKMIVQALLGLSGSFAGWVVYTFALALISRFTEFPMDAEMMRHRVAHQVPVLLAIAVLTGLAGCALSFLLRPPARSSGSPETSGATGGL